jgi:hypothetical protein
MSERSYLIVQESDGFDPWVLAETSDRNWAAEAVRTWNPSVVLAREEALLDPDYRVAVLAWEAGDDQTHAAWRAMEQADMAALEAAEREGQILEEIEPSPRSRESNPETDLHEEAYGTFLSLLVRFMERGDELREGFGAELVAYFAVQAKGLAEASQRHGRVV